MATVPRPSQKKRIFPSLTISSVLPLLRPGILKPDLDYPLMETDVPPEIFTFRHRGSFIVGEDALHDLEMGRSSFSGDTVTHVDLDGCQMGPVAFVAGRGAGRRSGGYQRREGAAFFRGVEDVVPVALPPEKRGHRQVPVVVAQVKNPRVGRGGQRRDGLGFRKGVDIDRREDDLLGMVVGQVLDEGVPRPVEDGTEGTALVVIRFRRGGREGNVGGFTHLQQRFGGTLPPAEELQNISGGGLLQLGRVRNHGLLVVRQSFFDSFIVAGLGQTVILVTDLLLMLD